MRKIWIDGFEANVSQRLGSGQVAFQLLQQIEAIDKTNDYTILLASPPIDDLPKERAGFRYRILSPSRLKTRIAIPFALYTAKQKPDVFFTPTHYIPRFAPKGVKRVVTIFDLAYFHFKEMFTPKDLWQLINWTGFSIKNADHIVTISNYSKQDIIKQYSLTKPNSSETLNLKQKITVAYPGYGSKIYFPIKNKAKIVEVLEKYKIDDDYVLFIGTVQPRKNLIRLIEAIAKIDNLKLVVVGKMGSGGGRGAWMAEETLNKPKELGIEDRVIFTGFVPDQDIGALMNGASVFAFPSLYEGFGIPVIDAFACGTPVVATNVSSIPEIVGEAALLVDPKSVDQIEQAIRVIISDKRLSNKLSRLGLEQAKKFSWKKMAKDVIKVLETV